LVVLALLAVFTAEAQSQVRRGRQASLEDRWAPVVIGARWGWQENGQRSIVGAHVRIPVVRAGQFELVPSFDRLFGQAERRETQYEVGVAWMPDGVRRGFLIGLGAVRRDAPLVEPDKDRFYGGALSLGGRSLIGPVEVEILARWTFLRGTDYGPSAVSFGLNLPLWRTPIPQREGPPRR
jgi:hypothetical protein